MEQALFIITSVIAVASAIANVTVRVGQQGDCQADCVH